MAGGGRAGLAVRHGDGSVLALADRIARHFTTSLVTVRTAIRNRRKLMEDFAAGRLRAASEPERSYLWRADQQEARALAELLELHGVKIRRLARPAEVAVASLAGGKEERTPRRFPAGSYVVSTAQPLGTLVQVLMEPEAPMTASFLERQRQRFQQHRETEFYDITAWALPLAYNLEVWVAAAEPGGAEPATESSSAAAAAAIPGGPGGLGFLVAPQGLASYRLAAELRRRGITYRVALDSFADLATSYPSGTLFVPAHGNPADLADQLATLLREYRLAAHALASSYDLKGISLGSTCRWRGRPASVCCRATASTRPRSAPSGRCSIARSDCPTTVSTRFTCAPATSRS